MKQLLLRVPDELHARLAEQARTKGISVNALANQVLGLAIDADALSRRDRLQLKLIALGSLGRDRTALGFDEVTALTEGQVDALRDKAVASMRGAVPVLDAVEADWREVR